MSPDRLAEVDRELDSLGKSEAELAGVFALVKSLRREVGDVDGELEMLGSNTSVREPPTALVPRIPKSSRPPPPVEEEVAEEDGERPTGLVKRPTSEIPSRVDDLALTSDPPPDFVSEPPPGGADIAGLSVDDLFADADPTGNTPSPNDGALADLFGEQPVARPSEPEVGSLFEMLEPGAPEPPPPGMEDELNPFAELEEEHTNIVAPPMTPPGREPTGEFELLIDDDVVALDDSEIEAIEDDDAPPDDEGGPEKKRGLFSRLLGRK